MTGRCPGCGHDVPLLPPRPIHSKARTLRRWRRQAHAVNGRGLNQVNVQRCRWTLTLAPGEIPEGAPTT